MSVLIGQLRNSNRKYSLSIVNILEEQLQTFALARVTFGTGTFSKELFFRNTYSLNVILLKERISDRSFILMTVLVSLGGSVSTIHSNTKRDLFNRAVAAIHSFRGHMEQIIFDSSQLLRPATFWKNIRVVLF